MAWALSFSVSVRHRFRVGYAMKADEIRRRYLEFFQRREHKLFPSDSLVPEGDASVLFTGAGMNQFKDAFLGKGPKNLTRATSSQKCLRMPDLDNVGRTRSHHTFFEMLGNFSFGDYFKREAIQWALEFLETELSIPRARLAFTVYTDDDEAAEIWQKEAGIPSNRIWRYGEKDNFWPAEAPSKGPNGPCGPCSEIYFDFGPEATLKKDVESDPAGDSDRYVEIWNLVFTQFDRRGENELAPLPRKNIDTGAGLERIARVMQGKPNNFETDLFAPMIERISELTGRPFGKAADDDRRMKRMADHVRAATFCIADGVRPGNEGRGYVVRKVIRRASMDLRELGYDKPGLLHLVPAVVAAMGGQYPELRERQALIQDTIEADEARFGEVYRQGADKLESILESTHAKRLAGKDAFFLWDTIGFPFDIAKRFCEERGVTVDEDGFEREMEAQRERARAGSQIAGDIFGTGPASRLKGSVEPTRFVGYDRTEAKARIVALLRADGQRVERAVPGDGPVSIVLDETPFYAESGGQVGDTGRLETVAGALIHVVATQKAEGYHLHVAELTEGHATVGEEVVARVDVGRRHDIMRNHTATHLLHWALRRVLGAETTQAGSLVHPDYLRFDYTAKRAPTVEQLTEVEDLVNGQVLKGLDVDKTERSFDEARAEGAMALFGEKYGDRVRVVRIVDDGDDGDDGADRERESVELCGGTHCRSTGQIGLFKIASDGAIAAGVRRIVAHTGVGAMRAVREKFQLARDVTERLKVPEGEVAARLESMIKEKSRLEKAVARARKEAASAELDDIATSGVPLDGGVLFVHRIDDAGQEELRGVADALVKSSPGAVVVLAGVTDGRVALVVACSPGAVQRGVKAGDLCRDLGKRLGGGGGGRPNMAQGQGTDSSGLDAAFEEVASRVQRAWNSS